MEEKGGEEEGVLNSRGEEGKVLRGEGEGIAWRNRGLEQEGNRGGKEEGEFLHGKGGGEKEGAL